METRTPKELLDEIKVATQLSEPKLAARLGVSQPTINRIMNGVQVDCSMKTLRAISRLHAEVTAQATA